MANQEREEEEVEQAKETMHELEEGDPPEKLEDWPDEGEKVDNPDDYKGERLPDAPEPED